MSKRKKSVVSVGDLLKDKQSELGKVIKTKPSEIKFIGKVVRIQQYDVFEDKSLGFSARVMAQAGLPHSDPGDDCDLWTRVNGNFCFSVQSKRYRSKDGQVVNVGIPYGTYARLILYHIATEATKHKSPHIDLDTSLSKFMKRLGLMPTGGKKGTITGFKEQIRRITTSRFDFTVDDRNDDGVGGTLDHMFSVAESLQLWWDPKDPETDTFPSSMVLTDRFYKHIIEHPVPIDMRAIDAIKNSPLALDLYTWLTARVYNLDSEIAIPWALLHKQMGAEYNDQDNFTKASKKYLLRISQFWPELNLKYARGRVILLPSNPHVPAQDYRIFS